MYESLLKSKIEYNIMTGNTSYSINEDVLPKELTQANFRRGKWTIEEENYTSRIIKDFENGEEMLLLLLLFLILHCFLLFIYVLLLLCMHFVSVFDLVFFLSNTHAYVSKLFGSYARTLPPSLCSPQRTCASWPYIRIVTFTHTHQIVYHRILPYIISIYMIVLLLIRHHICLILRCTRGSWCHYYYPLHCILYIALPLLSISTFLS